MAGGTAHADVYAARLGDSSLGWLLAALLGIRAIADGVDGRCQTQASNCRRA